jgi:hypothetical protein
LAGRINGLEQGILLYTLLPAAAACTEVLGTKEEKKKKKKKKRFLRFSISWNFEFIKTMVISHNP